MDRYKLWQLFILFIYLFYYLFYVIASPCVHSFSPFFLVFLGDHFNDVSIHSLSYLPLCSQSLLSLSSFLNSVHVYLSLLTRYSRTPFLLHFWVVNCSSTSIFWKHEASIEILFYYYQLSLLAFVLPKTHLYFFRFIPH